MSDIVESHLPCPDCGSSDALAKNSDGSTYCFSCSTHTKADNVIKMLDNLTIRKKEVMSLHKRKIQQQTIKKYNVVETKNSIKFPYYDSDNARVGYKVRSTTEKRFSYEGITKKSLLFGQNLFNKGAKYITLTEGEIDALSAFQMLGSKYPCVSLRNGVSGVAKDIRESYDWLISFDCIVICFDDDEVGRQASKKAAELLSPKARIMRMSYKDANEYLQSDESSRFTREWWASEAPQLEGIVAGHDLLEAVMAGPTLPSCLYPYVGLNDLTYGIRMSELITITAGTGIGKSSFLREIVYHMLKETQDNIVLMFLEEDVAKTAKAITGLHLTKPIHLPKVEYTDEELREAFDETMGKKRIYLFDHFGSNEIDEVVNRVRYFAKVLGCKYVIIDHITIIVSSQQSGDERRSLDEIMTRLRTLVQELQICLMIASHLRRPANGSHEEGGVTSLAQLRGSHSIGQLSDIVLGLERNGQAEDIEERHTTRVRVIKNRFSGLTGPACALRYNRDTGRMLEIVDDFETEEGEL